MYSFKNEHRVNWWPGVVKYKDIHHIVKVPLCSEDSVSKNGSQRLLIESNKTKLIFTSEQNIFGALIMSVESSHSFAD